MKPLFSLLGFLVLACVPARADVLIYKGTARATSDVSNAAALNGPLGVYLLVDFDTRKVASILTYKINETKM